MGGELGEIPYSFGTSYLSGEARAVTAIRRYKGDICGSVVAVLRTGFALPAPGCTFDS